MSRLVLGHDPRGSRWHAPLWDVLAEQVPGHPQWVTAVSRRLVVASAGPVLGPLPEGQAEGPLDARARAAGWPSVGAGEDPDRVRAEAWELTGPLGGLGEIAGVGSLAPKLIVVGEAVTRAGQVPFHSRSGTRLWAALRLLGWDELDVRVTNALGSDRRPFAGEQLRELARVLGPDCAWLTLGEVAHKALRKARVPHAHSSHPAWHARFKAGEGMQGFAERLEAAGVPRLDRGPLALPALREDPPGPTLRVEGDLPPLPGFAGRLAGGVGYRRQAASAGHGIARELLVQARNLFVVGEVRTVAELAARMALDVGRLNEVARAEGWRAEREARRRRLAAEALERADETEVQRLSEARRIAWDCVVAGLEDVRERIFAARGVAQALERLEAKRSRGDQDARPLHPTCAGAKALAQAAVLLRTQRPGAERTRGTLQDLVREVMPLLERAEAER